MENEKKYIENLSVKIWSILTLVEKIKSFCLFCLTHVFLVLLLQPLRAGNSISFLVISYTYMCVRIFGHIYLNFIFF